MKDTKNKFLDLNGLKILITKLDERYIKSIDLWEEVV